MKQFIRRMSSDLASLRLKYKEKKDVFLEKDIELKEPFHLFRKWLDDACKTPEILEPNAVCLSTATKEGVPVVTICSDEKCYRYRINILHQLRQSQSQRNCKLSIPPVVFGSHKRKIFQNENPHVAMTFYWVPLRRQVRVEGKAEKVPTSDSEEYFHQRPRDSQIGALASPQSQTIPGRDYLDQIEAEIRQKLGPDGVVPLPNWGGYLVVPHRFEFWQGQSNRVHDRIQFRKTDDTTAVDNKLVFQGEKDWVYERLAP
ncbi:hypothetical protein HA402_013119 [Bradysia odoriphaga]|nr:hypothetical protein HA402_013119 [Bradysia odoriphaga]